MPKGYDLPISGVFPDISASSSSPSYRAQLFINGWQFGKYISNLGPQTKFPVPEGILNYHGENALGLTVWAMEDGGAIVKGGLSLEVTAEIQSGYNKEIEVVSGERWRERAGAY